MMELVRTAYRHRPSPGNSRTLRGAILTIPVASAGTNGRFAVIEARFQPGSEPPPHLHEWEDETFHVLEGRAAFFCGRERFVAQAGDCVFIPYGVPHAMRFLTPCVRALAVISAAGERPVDLDRFFFLVSTSAKSLDLPVTATGQAEPADPVRAARLASEHGMRILDPVELRELMPGWSASHAGPAGSVP